MFGKHKSDPNAEKGRVVDFYNVRFLLIQYLSLDGLVLRHFVRDSILIGELISSSSRVLIKTPTLHMYKFMMNIFRQY